MDARIPSRPAEPTRSYDVPDTFVEPPDLADLFEGIDAKEQATLQRLVNLPKPPAELPTRVEPSLEDLQSRLANLRGGKKSPHPDAVLAARARELLEKVLPEIERNFAALPIGPDARTATAKQLNDHMLGFKRAVEGLTQNLQKYAQIGVNPKAKLAASGYADMLQSRLRLESQYLGNAAVQGSQRHFAASDVRALQSRLSSVSNEASQMTDLRGQLTAQAFNAVSKGATKKR